MNNSIIFEYMESKEAKYELLVKQIEALIANERDVIANAANISALLKETFDFWWVGFYFVKNNELVLGPFQGPVACTRIAFGKGVCGTSWKEQKTLIVDDVHQFPGHIACSAQSNSEIVVPVKQFGEVIGVLDVDSKEFANFDDVDQQYLEKIVALL